jgi:TonB family protein
MQSGNHEITPFAPVSNSAQIVAELQTKIRMERLSSDSRLQQIVEVARSLTCAQGAAIAMRQNNLVLCTARSGSMAPDLGSELNADSGISGQCLRTGAALRCDDTSTDTRVDPEVCRRLGLRSVAVAPVGKKPRVSGVLEVFSANPRAFNDNEVRLLAELAELVVPAQRTWTKSAVLKAGQKLASATRTSSKGKFILAGAIFAFVIWVGFRGIAVRPNPSAAQPQPQPLSSLVPSSLAAEPSASPSVPVRSPAVRAPNERPSFAPGVVMASATEKTRPAEPEIRRKPQQEAASESNAGTIAANPRPAAPKSALDAFETAPPLAVVSVDRDAALAPVLPPASALPLPPAVKLSTGVSGGTVERFVKPIYPPDALRLKRQGRVVLQALVTEEGSVRDIKVLDGDSLLARAAMDAVAEWHYRPYRLNGQPIQRTTEVTIIFRLP